ncbi:MAG: DUF2917 domain-containing protein [Casimicrobiaceae bacterium]
MAFETTAGCGRRTFLPRRHTLVLDDAEGTVLSVDSGVLWITLERDPRDIILFPGMRFEIDRTGRTVVVAEEDAQLHLTPPVSAFERMAAWARAAAKRTLRDWSRQMSRRKVSYY